MEPVEVEQYDAARQAPIRRDTKGLRNALFDEMEALRQGRSSADNANAIARLGNTIIASVRMEVDVHRYLQTQPVVTQEPMIALGSPIDL